MEMLNLGVVVHVLPVTPSPRVEYPHLIPRVLIPSMQEKDMAAFLIQVVTIAIQLEEAMIIMEFLIPTPLLM